MSSVLSDIGTSTAFRSQIAERLGEFEAGKIVSFVVVMIDDEGRSASLAGFNRELVAGEILTCIAKTVAAADNLGETFCAEVHQAAKGMAQA